MRMQTNYLPGALIILALSASCTSPSGDLVSAIKNTGFECENLTTARELDADGTIWRIACGDTRAYLASFEKDGRICVSPLLYLETPVSKIALEFQWPPQDAQVVRCI